MYDESNPAPDLGTKCHHQLKPAARLTLSEAKVGTVYKQAYSVTVLIEEEGDWETHSELFQVGLAE